MKNRMKSTDFSRGRPWARQWFVAVLLVVAAIGCQAQSSEPTGGETHFLRTCDGGSDSCGGGFSCLCGVCTTECSINTPCADLPGAQCITLNSSCETVVQVCDVECTADQGCATLSSAHHCIDGRCRLASADSSALGAGGAGQEAGLCGGEMLVANEVVILGDSFFSTTHEVTGYLEAMARQDGAMSDGERFRDYSNLTLSTLAAAGPGIATQYEGAQAESDVKVVIMNAGGADILLGCDALDPQCPVLADAVQALEVLFSQMNTDGVEQVVFAGYPNPVPDDISAKMDRLRPLLEQACSESPVPCLWIDLRLTFDGHEDEFVLPDGINPTSRGAEASATALWSAMQESCIGR